MKNGLEIDNLCIEADLGAHGRIPIIKNVSLSVAPGETVALIGQSGSGKTTLGLTALGYLRPGLRIVAGQVRIDGQDLFALSPGARRSLRSRVVSYIAQSAAAAFNPAHTIGAQVIEGPLIHRLNSPAEARAIAIDIYRRLRLQHVEKIGRRYPHEVSGGQLQRLMAAMAMVCRPGLLVFDEPTTALDVTTQVGVLRAFKEAIGLEGTSALYVSHDLPVVAQIADRIVVLKDGETLETGPTNDVIEKPQQPYTVQLLAAVTPSLRRTPAPRAGASLAQPPLLSARNIQAGYGSGLGSIQVLSQISLDVARGEAVAVIGESGSGKSTLARVLCGLLKPTAGLVMLEGRPLPAAVRERQRADIRRIQLVSQMPDVSLNPRQRVQEILGRPLRFYGGITGAQQHKRVADLLEMVELDQAFATRFPGELSGGQKQRVSLARALAADPDIILCDEVTSALDTIISAAIIKLLMRLQKDLGVAFLLISHDLNLVASFAQRITVLYAGRLMERGTVAQTMSAPWHPYTGLLISSVPELRRGWLESLPVSVTDAPIHTSAPGSHGGCPFYQRCPLRIPGTCDRQPPPLRQAAPGHEIACHRELSELRTLPSDGATIAAGTGIQ